MATLRQLIDGLLGSREGVHPGLLAFPAIEIGEVARQLNLERIGLQEGSEGFPPSDTTAPDRHEEAILGEIRRRFQKASQEYHSQLSIYDARIRKAVHLANQRPAIESAAQRAISDYQFALKEDRDLLHRAQLLVAARNSEFERFRRSEEIDRLPVERSVQSQVLHRAWVVFLFLIETILNGTFFAQGSEQGLVGGFGAAFGFSALNVVAAYFIGAWGWRQLGHRSGMWKIAGAVVAAAHLMFTAWWNTLVGHYRDLFASNSGNVQADEVFRRMGDGLNFDDLPSLLLVLLGVGIALMTILAAYRSKDPYPGYAEAAERRTDAMDDYRARASECRDNLAAIRDRGLEDLKYVVNALSEAEHDIGLALAGRERLHRAYIEHIDDLASAQRQLVEIYRGANRRTRMDEPPEFFRHAPPTAWAKVDPLPDPNLEEPMRQAHELVEAVTGYIRHLTDMSTHALEQYASIADLTTRDEKLVTQTHA